MTTELPVGSTLGKSYEYGFDVNLGTYDTPVWQEVRRMSGYQPNPQPQTQDAQTYDDLGAPNADVVGWSHAHSFNVLVNRSITTGEYLPEVEALMARTRPSAKGQDAVADVRWYHKPEAGVANPVDAGRGFVTVAAQRANTGNAEIEKINFSLTGKGPAEEITNPYTVDDSPAAAISSVLPSGQGATEQVTVTGTGFTGATDVKFGATSATAFTVLSSTTIVASLPAGSAGSVNVTVITPVGTSPVKAYTRTT